MKAFRIKTRWWVIVSHREPVTIIKRNLTLTSHSPQYAQIPPRSLNPTVALVRSHCSRERMTRVHLICNHPKFWGTLFKWFYLKIAVRLPIVVIGEFNFLFVRRGERLPSGRHRSNFTLFEQTPNSRNQSIRWKLNFNSLLSLARLELERKTKSAVLSAAALNARIPLYCWYIDVCTYQCYAMHGIVVCMHTMHSVLLQTMQ